MRLHRVAWIPWVLAVVALLGINAFVREDPRSRRNETADGVGISLAAEDFEAIGSDSSLLVIAPPAPLGETLSLDPGSRLLKLEAGKDFKPASLRHGPNRVRAPPCAA